MGQDKAHVLWAMSTQANAARQTAELEKEGKDRPGAPRYNFGILPFLASRKTEGKSQQVK
jgi:hypothetical protein